MELELFLLEPNDEGLGLQDEYLRSDGIGRDFLKLKLVDLLHHHLRNSCNKKHYVIKKVKQYSSMPFQIWQK